MLTVLTQVVIEGFFPIDVPRCNSNSKSGSQPITSSKCSRDDSPSMSQRSELPIYAGTSSFALLFLLLHIFSTVVWINHFAGEKII
jgi:hypothetical protein